MSFREKQTRYWHEVMPTLGPPSPLSTTLLRQLPIPRKKNGERSPWIWYMSFGSISLGKASPERK
jgi:hypothetical protein